MPKKAECKTVTQDEQDGKHKNRVKLRRVANSCKKQQLKNFMLLASNMTSCKSTVFALLFPEVNIFIWSLIWRCFYDIFSVKRNRSNAVQRHPVAAERIFLWVFRSRRTTYSTSWLSANHYGYPL